MVCRCALGGAPYAMLATHGSWCCDGWLSPDDPMRDARYHAAQAAHPVCGRPRRTYPASIEMPA
eukprot:4634125-Prymnesium_polylepis.1